MNEDFPQPVSMDGAPGSRAAPAATGARAPSIRRSALALALFSAQLLSGCWVVDTRRWPEPMGGRDLPPGDAALHTPGPEEVGVLRHADPVKVRPAGSLSGVPLRFFDKRTRLNAGGAVIVAPGGRAEVLWASGSSIVMFGQGIGWVGSPSRGEPMFEFETVERARLELSLGDQVRLAGGAILSGASGPYLLEGRRDDTLAVHNHSTAPASVDFRDETFVLGPGEGVILPLLSSGGAPFPGDLGLQRLGAPAFPVLVRGPVSAEELEGGVRVDAVPGEPGGREVRALGVRVLLDEKGSAVFTGLETPPPAPPPPPEVGDIGP